MDTLTLSVAGMGFAATLASAWLTGRNQQQTDIKGRLLDAKITVFGECSDWLYEYQRTSYNRARSRLEGHPQEQRERLRQETYQAGTRARSAIGRLSILTGDENLRRALDEVRGNIAEYSSAQTRPQLDQRRERVLDHLAEGLERARSHLTDRQ